MSNNRESIKVICRIRPENQREIESGCKPCIVFSAESVKLQIEGDKTEGHHEFTFDRVFGSNSKQEEVFDFCAKPIIDSALEGYNGTIFCYGQTSSGKTFTMEGVHKVENLRGIIPRSMEYIFELIKNSSSDIEFSVKCSYLEIYNEKIQDLLDPRKTNLMVKEEKEKGLWVQDATEVYVGCEEEMEEVFQIGTENRTVGNTKMNAKSSRSHSLFIVTIFQRDCKTDSTKAGKLYFVDLAGSEKISKTGVEGQLLEDAKNINKSLLMLGMVINALTENKPYVPYRDSKLTRVLQESLGGNSLTTLIVTCSPNAFNDKESLSTLRFGQRAKSIKNKVVVNAEKSAKELLIKLNEAEETIKYYQNILTKIEMAEGLNFSLKDFLIENKISIIDRPKDKSAAAGGSGNKKEIDELKKSLSKKSSFDMKEKQNNSNLSDNFSNSIQNTNNSNNDLNNNNSNNQSSNKFTFKKCEDCSDAMKKVLNQHIELVTLQDEVEKLKDIKAELEIEIENRNHEIFERNEKILLIEMQTKNFIKSQQSSINDLILKLDQIFLFNQKKFSLSSSIKNIYDSITNELKEFKSAGFNNSKESANSNKSIVLIEKVFKHIEDSYTNLQKIERLILNDNKIFNRIIEIMNEISLNLENHISANFGEENLDGDNLIVNRANNNNNLIGGSQNAAQNFNNINLNFNKNININIINSKDNDEINTSSISNKRHVHKKNVSVSHSDISADIANQKRKRTNSFSYFDKDEYYKEKIGYSIDASNNKHDLKAISIFNNIKNELNFNTAVNNNRKKLSLIIDANKISKINKVNHYSPIYHKKDNLSGRNFAREKSRSLHKKDSSDLCSYNLNDNSHSHSSNNNPNFDLDVPESDPYVENQLKAFDNYDCVSVCTEFETNKLNKITNSIINANLSNTNFSNANNNNNFNSNTDVETNATANNFNSKNNTSNNNNYNSYNNYNNNDNCNNNETNGNSGGNYKDVIQSQRKTIINLAQKYKKIEYALFNFKKENYEKENTSNKNNNMKIKEYENLIQGYEEKIAMISKEYEDYKVKALEDFAYKEKKLMDLINKISDLEDENFRIIHSNKDMDKKKYLLMEKKTKDLTLELQRLISENSESKNIIDKRNEEINNLYLRIKDLEMKIVNLQDLSDNLNKIINELKYMENHPHNCNLNNNNNTSNNNNNYNKNSSRKNRIEFINNISKPNIGTGFVCNNNNEVSFSNMNPSAIESGICTPITNYLNQKNFDQKKLNEMIVPKLHNLKKEKENSNSNEGFANRNLYQNRNQSNNFNISEISNFSLKNNPSLFQAKSNENSNETLHPKQKPSQDNLSNVSFNNENNYNNELEPQDSSGYNNHKLSSDSYINREHITHKLKDSNLNNPFSKNYKPNLPNYYNVNNNNNNNLSSNSNANYDFNYNQQSLFQSNGSIKLRSGGANRIMRVIKGGNGAKQDNTQNHFFSKMLNTNEKTVNPLFMSFDPSIRNSIKNTNNNKAYKINIDKLQREKFEQELRMLDCDNLNNSGDSEMKVGSNTNREFGLNNNNIVNYNNVNNTNNNNRFNNVNKNQNQNYFTNGKNYKYDDNPMSSRVKTPEKNARSSIWNLFS